MWTCTKCGEKLEDNFDTCWKCGTLKEGFLPAVEEKKEELEEINNKDNSIKKSTESTVPWENRKEMGTIKALWQTTKEVLFHPSRFFDKLVGSDSLSHAFSFYIAIITASFLIEIIVLALSSFSTLKFIFSTLFSFPLIIFLVPIFIVIGIYLSTAIMHLFVLLFRGEGGYEGTFNVMVYSCVTELWFFLLATIAGAIINLFLIITKFLPPAVKLLVGIVALFILPVTLLAGVVWMFVVAVVGYMRIHRFGIIRASCAFLIPIIILGSIQYTINKKEKEKAPESLEKSLERLEQSKTRAYEAAAKARIIVISSACQAYFTDKREYPPSLKDLTSTKPPYIESNLAEANSSSVTLEGYYYVYKFLDKDHFTLYAQPVETNVPGGKIFFIDQSGILRLDGPSGASEESLKAVSE